MASQEALLKLDASQLPLLGSLLSVCIALYFIKSRMSSSDSAANMPSPKRTVLITGCSDGGMGAALALAFRKAGFNVIATARNPSKMAGLRSAGVGTMALDILSDASIAEAVSKVSS
ncbi:hypothetical protein F66182_17560, partial [Fusarium sp. NRRL 66182]